MWEAVKTRMSGRAVWEWAAVVVFVGVLATLVVYATNPDGTLEITPDDNDSKHVWGINETISYTATCTHTCDTECNTGFDETAGLTPTDNYDDDGIAYVSGTKPDTGSYTLEAECPEDGSHGDASQSFTVVDIDYLSVDSVQKTNGATVCCAMGASGNYTVTATLAPTAASSELRTDFLNWTKTAGTLDFTKVDELTITVPKAETGSITVQAKAGASGTVWSVTLVVAAMDLDAEGSSNGDEIDPGAFVLINEDDDDQDGTDDDSDTNGVTEEDDLLELTMPAVLPEGASVTDTMTLSWTGEAYIDVFSNVNRTGAITSPQSYSLSDSPQKVYVEGVTAYQSATFTLTYTSGVTVSDSVVVTVLESLDMYRDSGATNTLDEWEADTDSLRSPKYIFGEEDNIYVRLLGPTGLGDDYFSIQAKSESYPTGVTLKLSEIDDGVYQNTAEDGELLRLSYMTTYSSPAYYLKVNEEEVMNFVLKIDGDEIGEKDVMVDRGEFATMTIRSYEEYCDPAAPQSATPYPYANQAADEFAHFINVETEYGIDGGDLDWRETLYLRGYYYLGENDNFYDFFLFSADTSAGSYPYWDGESDVFYAVAHGDSSGDLAGTESLDWAPPLEDWETVIDIDTDLGDSCWKEDVDWVIITACSILNHSGDGRDEYERMLEIDPPGRPRGIHGVLAFEDGAVLTYYPYIENFMGEIGARHTMISSWINANTDVTLGDQPYGILYQNENYYDVLRPASEGSSLGPDMSDVDAEYSWRDELGATGTYGFGLPEDKEERQITVRLANGKSQDLKVPMAVWKRPLDTAVARGYRFDLGRLNPDGGKFNHVVEWDSNRVKLTSNFNSRNTSLTEGEASEIARQFITQHGLPDAVLEVAKPMYIEHDGQTRTIGYTLVFKHHEDGVLVAGDGMTMIVQPEGVTLLAGLWHEIETNPGKKIEPMEFDQPAMEACARSVVRRFDGVREVPGVKWVRPAYYVGDIVGNDEAPARAVWEVCFEGDRREYWDPAKREVIDLLAVDNVQRYGQVRKAQ